MDKAAEDKAFAEHRDAQIKRLAAETSCEQRLNWLQSALEFAHAAGVDYLAQKHARIERERQLDCRVRGFA